MSVKRRKLQRLLGARRYKKLFVLAVEGSKTEPQYFSIFDDKYSAIKINCLSKRRSSSPKKVLDRIEEYLKKEGLQKTDEAWIVIDKDEWTDEQILPLVNWSQKKENYGFALSNPCFEYWLLLHFEEGNDIRSLQECRRRLNRYFPDYDKGIVVRKFTDERI